jgi:hypothetical protein
VCPLRSFDEHFDTEEVQAALKDAADAIMGGKNPPTANFNDPI